MNEYLPAIRTAVDTADGRNKLSASVALGAWIVTFTLSAPCHRKLQHNGKDPEIIARLIHTNWLRMVCWITVFSAGLMRASTQG